MKNIYRAVLVSTAAVLTVFSADTAINDRIISENSFTIDTDQEVQFDGTKISRAGEPSLPLVTRRYLLPANFDESSLEITIEGDREKVLNGSFNVAPTRIFTSDENGNYVEVEHETELHTGLFPASNIYDYSLGKLGEYNILTLSLAPYRYNNGTKVLRFSDTLDIKISYNNTSSSRSVSTGRYADRVAEIVNNYNETAASYGSFSRASDKGHYLILTSSAILPQLTELDAFTASKEAQGLKVSVLTEEAWGGTKSNGDFHQVREWLKENYESEGYSHLLIIDNPVTGAVPMLTVVPDYSGRYEPLVDFPYGDLSGEWDLDGNGKYGEYGAFDSKDFAAGGADQFQEIAVGRLPYYGDAAIINKILKRIVEYSAENSTDAAWRKHLYMPMSDFDVGAYDGSKFGAVINSNVVKKSDWDVSEIYGYDCNHEAVISLWNESNPGVVLWQAHGLADYAQHLIYSREAPQLTVPTHTYQVSCHTGKPEDPNNLAFAILKSSAISTIGAAVQCQYTYNKSFYGERGGARDYGYMYVKHMILNKKPAGESLAAARGDLTIRSSSDWLNCVETNLYGCPAVGAYTTDVTGSVAIKNKNKSTLSPGVVRTPAGITLTSLAGVFRGGRVTLYSLAGRKVDEIAVAPGSNSIVITGNALASGIYIASVKLLSEEGVHESTIRFSLVGR